MAEPVVPISAMMARRRRNVQRINERNGKRTAATRMRPSNDPAAHKPSESLVMAMRTPTEPHSTHTNMTAKVDKPVSVKDKPKSESKALSVTIVRNPERSHVNSSMQQRKHQHVH